MASVLDGVRVLDLSWGIAGPIAGMLLADHGADVDQDRAARRRPVPGPAGYDVWLRGRRSAVLDLKAGRRPRPLPDLVDGADVVLESFSPGTTTRLGLDADTLLGPQPAAGRLLDHRLRAARRPIATGPATTPSWPPGSASSTSSAATSAAPSPTCTARSRSSPTSRSPTAWRPARPARDRSSPTRPWPSLGAAFLATTGHQRRPVRPRAHRAGASTSRRRSSRPP